DPEDHIVKSKVLCERRLRERTTSGVRPSLHGKQVVNSTIGSRAQSSVRIQKTDKPGFARRAIGSNERRQRVGCAGEIVDKGFGIGTDKWISRCAGARPSHAWLRMAIRALIAVEAGPKAIRDSCPNNIDLLESCLSVGEKFERARVF